MSEPKTVPLKNEAGKVIGTAQISQDGKALMQIDPGFVDEISLVKGEKPWLSVEYPVNV
jgi:hypothetical protein